MRIRRLDLLRYGHLADRVLEFPPEATLHVVHGVNEAGKSTALDAIADALFGFAARSKYDFLYGGPQLRIGFTLADRDGAEAGFVRRKGRGSTLTDRDNNALPEDALRRFLGGVGRDLFEEAFGLDGDRLRAGAAALLRSGGEAGESLLAGAGFLNLRAALDSLDNEAKSLVGDGRGQRALSIAVAAWQDAQRAADDRAIAPKEWQAAEVEHAAAVAGLTEVQTEARALAIEDSRLQRVRRVAQILAALDAARIRLETLKDVPHLPADAGVRLDTADAARRDAGRDRLREADTVARLTAEQAALPRDPAVLAIRDAIEALTETRPIAVQAETDLPTVRAAAASHRAKVVDALRDLGLTRPPEVVREAIPAPGLRQTVQRLIAAHAESTAKANAAQDALAAAQRRRDRAAAALVATPPPFSASQPSPEHMRRTIEAVRAEGPLDTDYDRACRAADEADRALAAALAALPLWQGDAAALEACPIPLPATAQTMAATLDRTAARLTEARAAFQAIEDTQAAVAADIARLSQEGIVPTPEAVAAARAQRDRVWLPLRAALHEGVRSDRDAVASFETLRDEADRLADRRADDAQRVADYLSATAHREQLRARQAEAGSALTAAEAAAIDADRAWRALWAPSGVAPESPAAMAEWRRQRADVLQRAERAAEAHRQREDLGARRDRARRALAADATASLMVLLLRAETDCIAAEAAATAHRRCVEALAREDAQLPDLQAVCEAADTARAGWANQWADAVAALGLPRDAATETAEAALAAWSRIAEAAPAWRSDDARIADMAAVAADFGRAAATVRAQLGESDTGEPAPAAAARAARRLADALRAEQVALELTARIATHAAAQAEAARRHADAEADIAALRAAAGVDDDAALARTIEQARQRAEVVQDADKHAQNLAASGDGLLESDLRAEAAGIAPDSAAGRLAEIEARQAALGDRRESLSAERTRTEARLADMRAGHDAATKVQEAENALADARAAAERYARLHLARELLRGGIDRYRRARQDPLLRAASAHFALLTGDRYRRLGTDPDAAGKAVLLAIDAAGGACPVEGLSEGTRDQLYLALRVAAIEAHVAHAEPLPFVADDLLVNFDDTRAAAGLRLLAELGRTTQVILFTHHDHLAAMAEAVPGASVLRLPPPGGRNSVGGAA